MMSQERSVLLGTPAEESGAGKQILMDRGAYNDMDVCIMCHPTAGETQEMGFVSSLALQSLSVEYFGQTPAAVHTQDMRRGTGVNALDAAFVAYAGISALRQQIRPEQRVHGVISGRDWAPNVIPDYAKVSWSVRAETRDALEQLRDRVGIHSLTHAYAVGEPYGLVLSIDPAEARQGVATEIALGERYLDLRQNPVLAEDLSSTAHRSYGIPSYWSTSPASASTDFGNVSHALPALHPIFTIPSPDGAQNHSLGFARAARSEAAHTAALRTAALLAHTGFRVHADGVFCARVRAAYDAGTDAAAAAGATTGASAGAGRWHETTTA
ncbi:hypothetical protein EDB87DRAFT_1707407 [Lactarius vividus]|nr:hypothetical protein EDB87DRAFT_1707407 [Lactarius vividus]